MAKKSKKLSDLHQNLAVQQPRLEPGTVINIRSLVVDTKGVAWWVDPDGRNIERAT